MERRNNKKKFIFMLVFLLMIGLSIGYAVLTQQLTIDNTISYDSMKWDVGFTEVVDLSQYNPPENFILANVEISQDKKSISVACDIGVRTDAIECIGVVKIDNDSTFDVILDSINTGGGPANLSHLSKYLVDQSVNVCISIDNCEELVPGYVLKAGESRFLGFNYSFKELTEDILPETDLTINFSVLTYWVEAPKVETINFQVDGVDYFAEEGMTWEEWVNSEYNVDGFYIINNEIHFYSGTGIWMVDEQIDSVIIPDKLYEAIFLDHASSSND